MRSKWNRDSAALDFDESELNRLIAPAFPKSRITKWQHTEGGLANTNICLFISDRENPILLRLFVRDPKQAKKEWSINQLVSGHVPAPEFIHFSSDNPITGHPYILMDWVDAIRMEEVILNLQKIDLESLGRSVGSALASIHDFKFENAGFLDDELMVDVTIELGGKSLIDYAKKCLIDGDGGTRLGTSLTDRLIDFLESEAFLLDQWHGKPCLAHSDFGGSNILVKQDEGKWKVAAVLDWEFAFSGNPFFDFGNLLRAPHGTVAYFQKTVTEGYLSNGGQLPDHWRKMSLLTDLTAWMEFMTRKSPGESLISDAKRVISETIEGWNSLDKNT